MPYPEKIRLNLGLKLSNGTPPTGGAIPTTRLVYSFDGLDDYLGGFLFSFSNDFYINAKIKPSFPDFYFLASKNTDSNRLAISGATVFISLSSAHYNGAPLLDDSWIADGDLHEISFRRESGVIRLLVDGVDVITPFSSLATLSFDSFCSRWRGFTNVPFYSGILCDIDVNGESFYPVDDGWGNNPNIRDTVGVQDGTANNFNAERWEEINV